MSSLLDTDGIRHRTHLVCIGQRSPRATAANTARLRDWPQAPELAGRLVCIKGFAITGDFQPDDPVCVHPDNRVEDERCENNDALCGEGMICSFSGTCVVRECNVDEDCAEGLVCHLPDLRRAQARAHRRRGWARRVSSLRATRATAASR